MLILGMLSGLFLSSSKHYVCVLMEAFQTHLYDVVWF
jgi:hypothetical protein